MESRSRTNRKKNCKQPKNRVIKMNKRNHKFWSAYYALYRVTLTHESCFTSSMSLQKYAFFSRRFVRSLCLPNKTEKKKRKNKGSLCLFGLYHLSVCVSHVIKCVKRKQLANNRKKCACSSGSVGSNSKTHTRGHSSQRPRRMLISYLDILFVCFFCRFDQGHFGRKK